MSEAAVAFDELVEKIFAVLWKMHPGTAVYLGRHEYDAAVPEWSQAQVATHLDDLRRLSGEMEALEGLDDDRELDRTILSYRVREEIFVWETLREPLRNPMSWVYALDPDVYMNRSYAPLADRAAVVTRLLTSAGPFMAQAMDRLDEVLATTICEWGMTAAEGLADMVADDVPVAFADVAAEDPHGHAALMVAAEKAADELRTFAAWLRDERLGSSTGDFAIGRGQMEELLHLGEIVTMDLDRLLAVAEDDLAKNLEAFRETAASIDPELSPREVYDRYVAVQHATRGELVSETESMLEDIRSFLIDRDIISIPSEVRAMVAATPRHLRWAFAMMDTPGPYETTATEAYYYVTPCEESWSDEQAEAWLRTLNTFVLEAISIHEAYPGHYVHFLHYDNAPTEVSKRLASYAFSEGWAHYTEQMMWEQGFREGDPRFRLAQLAEALVRNCRFVCAIRLHAHGMTVDEATEFFVENAYYEELAARKEAERGTFDPGYFSYTLGKIEILRVRDEWQRKVGGSIKEFHDVVLSRGAPPIGLLQKLVVG